MFRLRRPAQLFIYHSALRGQALKRERRVQLARYIGGGDLHVNGVLPTNDMEFRATIGTARGCCKQAPCGNQRHHASAFSLQRLSLEVSYATGARSDRRQVDGADRGSARPAAPSLWRIKASDRGHFPQGAHADAPEPGRRRSGGSQNTAHTARFGRILPDRLQTTLANPLAAIRNWAEQHIEAVRRQGEALTIQRGERHQGGYREVHSGASRGVHVPSGHVRADHVCPSMVSQTCRRHHCAPCAPRA